MKFKTVIDIILFLIVGIAMGFAIDYGLDLLSKKSTVENIMGIFVIVFTIISSIFALTKKSK
jgi:hypothetical protein